MSYFGYQHSGSPCMGLGMGPAFHGTCQVQAFNPLDMFMHIMGATLPQASGGRNPRQREDEEWTKIVKLPPCFRAEDVKVTCEGRTLKIIASREESNETGVNRRQVSNKVEVPASVAMETVRTLWKNGTGLVIVGKKAQGTREEDGHPGPFHVDPNHLKAQVETTLDDVKSFVGGCPMQSSTGCTTASASSPQHPLQAFLNIDPAHITAQVMSFVEDLQNLSQPPASTTQSSKQESESTKASNHREEPEAKNQQDAEPMDEGTKEVNSEEDWVKPSTDDLAVFPESASPAEADEPEKAKTEEETLDITQFIVTKNPSQEEPEFEPQKPARDVLNITSFIQEKEEPIEDLMKVKTSSTHEPPAPQKHQVCIDVTGYWPDEVVVATQGQKVKVTAHHVGTSEGEEEEYSFQRTMTLPKSVNVEELTWEIEDNVLVVSAPVL